MKNVTLSRLCSTNAIKPKIFDFIVLRASATAGRDHPLSLSLSLYIFRLFSNIRNFATAYCSIYIREKNGVLSFPNWEGIIRKDDFI